MKWRETSNRTCSRPFNSHFFSQLALPNGRAGERNERVDGHWLPFAYWEVSERTNNEAKPTKQLNSLSFSFLSFINFIDWKEEMKERVGLLCWIRCRRRLWAVAPPMAPPKRSQRKETNQPPNKRSEVIAFASWAAVFELTKLKKRQSGKQSNQWTEHQAKAR